MLRIFREIYFFIDLICFLSSDEFLGITFTSIPLQNRKKLFPEGLREEYMKGSKKINIFSKISQSLSETVSNDELKQKIKNLEEKNMVIHHLQEKKLVENEQSEHETKRLEQVLANQGEIIKSMQE